jgi:hypothetical protein
VKLERIGSCWERESAGRRVEENEK